MAPPNLQAQPQTPLTFSNMTRENYMNDACPPSGAQYQNGPIAPPNYSAGDFSDVMSAAYATGPKYVDQIQVSLPVKDMTSISGTGDEGNGMQPVVYDRFMVANLKSRQASLGDFFRGDLAIIPNQDVPSGWFNTTYTPARDLNQGALFVMGGLDNSSAMELANLINYSSGGSKNTIAGHNLTEHFAKVRENAANTGSHDLSRVNMSNQTMMGIQPASQDVISTSFLA